MSHQFTRHEIDSAKVQVLQEELAEVAKKVPNDELYDRAICLLKGGESGHTYDGDPNIEDDKPEVEEYDE